MAVLKNKTGMYTESKQFSSDTAGYSKSRFELNVRKNACNKIILPIVAFLIIAAGL